MAHGRISPLFVQVTAFPVQRTARCQAAHECCCRAMGCSPPRWVHCPAHGRYLWIWGFVLWALCLCELLLAIKSQDLRWVPLFYHGAVSCQLPEGNELGFCSQTFTSLVLVWNNFCSSEQMSSETSNERSEGANRIAWTKLKNHSRQTYPWFEEPTHVWEEERQPVPVPSHRMENLFRQLTRQMDN